MPNFKHRVVLYVLCVTVLLAACSDSGDDDNGHGEMPPTSPITGQWTATEAFSSTNDTATNDTVTVAGNVIFSATLEENAGVIATNIEAVNDVIINLTQPTATTIERSRQGDASFVTGTLNGTQVVLEVDIGDAMQPVSLLIEGNLQNDDTITGEATLGLFGVTATSPITMNKQ